MFQAEGSISFRRDPLPQVPRAAGYDPINIDMAWFPPAVNGWGTKYSVPDRAPPLLAEGKGHST
jgi:hypothetical protein